MTEMNSKHTKLAEKLEQLQNALQSSSDIKFTLSDELLKSEEERLEISKILVETEIKCNALNQELEIQKFNHSNKMLSLENTINDFEEEINSLKTALFQEKERRKSAEGQINSASRDLELTKEKLVISTENCNKLSEKNDELYNHFVSLLKSSHFDHTNTIESIRKSFHNFRKESENPQNFLNLPTSPPKLGRRPTMSEYDQLKIEQEYHSNRAHFREEIERIRENYETQQIKLKKTIKDMQSQLCTAKVETKEKQEKLCDLTSKLIIKRHQLQNLESEYNMVQNRSHTWIDRFKHILENWMNHIAEFLDDVSNANESVISEKMTEYVERMLEDMKNAHNSREQQLCEAVQTTRTNLAELTGRHQKLLTSYKSLKLQVVDTFEIGYDSVDEGSVLSGDKGNIKAEKSLKNEFTMTQLELENMKLKDKLSNMNSKQENSNLEETLEQIKGENRRLESQIVKLESFIEKNLKKYKMEIQHMKYHVGNSLVMDKLIN